MTDRVCVAQIIGSHGVHGRLRVKSFTADPEALFDYNPLTDETGTRQFTLRMTGMGKDHLLVEASGVKGRDAADALKGVRLFVDRDRLPAIEDEDEFYHTDLIGLVTVTEGPEGDVAFGTIKAIHDFGAGDMLEINHVSGKTVFIPFSRACVPLVDVKASRVVVDPPVNLFTPARPDPEELAEMGGKLDLDDEPAAGESEADAVEETGEAR
ncbi:MULTISPECIES: ribosome maturation factor RimM [unclassified Azospirillum]|uniref:ribosome maturation factor RimM n=1 Tax=unclassified Azospirillum TaxID=2630922 RepID=UPI000B7237A4|nr:MULTISPECIES: ribosome maturation factor RimM [unclassified Azospirillum]SNS56870.1 16S rRNA processing protein RimM [Azospirillum sp. RU38E]SNS76419.1 16S rRNA processing protein RimM [Azospirillum sp. RU37A]